MVTTESEIYRYNVLSQNVTHQGMIQSTIYHIRQNGANVFDPEEREKYYSTDFLTNVRHVNDRVEQELEEFKVEIEEKVEANDSKFFSFPRPNGEEIHLNTDTNVLDVTHSNSMYHELPDHIGIGDEI